MLASNVPDCFSSSLLCGMATFTFGKKLGSLVKLFLWTWFRFFEKKLLKKFALYLTQVRPQNGNVVRGFQGKKEGSGEGKKRYS